MGDGIGSVKTRGSLKKLCLNLGRVDASGIIVVAHKTMEHVVREL